MNKREFLNLLRGRLSGLSPEELNSTLDFFSESIDDRVEEGFSEAEAVAGLGDLDSLIADQLRLQTERPKKKRGKPPILVGTGCLAAVIALPLGVAVQAVLTLVLFSTAFTLATVLLMLLPILLPVAAVAALWYGMQSCRLKWARDEYTVRNLSFAEPIDRIRLDDSHLKLQIGPSPDDLIHLACEESAARHYQVAVTGGVLAIEAVERYVIGGKDTPEMTLLLPRAYRGSLVLKVVNGKIAGADLQRLAGLAIELDNGKIELEDMAFSAPLACRLANGKINFTRLHCKDELTAEAVNGQVTLADVTAAGPATAKLNNGKIKLSNFAPAASATLAVEIGQISGTLLKPENLPLPEEITRSGTWGAPPNELKIKLRLGQIKVRTSTKTS